MTPTDFRKMALALPEAVESEHMDHPDFRIGGKIFASLGYPDADWAMVILPRDEQARLCTAEPEAFVPAKGAWGRAGSTQVNLIIANKPTVRAALKAAYAERVRKNVTRGSNLSRIRKKTKSVPMKALLCLVAAVLCAFSTFAADGDKLRIIAFGAHPDDCELQAGGTAAMWAAKGHKVKFVSVTNGDIGHWREAGGPLAKRRYAEVQEAAKILGIETDVLDIHDGELLPTLENRKLITQKIREWKADLVLGPRPNDYHPDHRYTGILVQDAAYMVTVPFFCPDVPHMTNNPVFMYYPDRFQKPNPFKPDVVVATDTVIEKRLDALDAMPSQFYEGGANGHTGLVPSDEAGKKARAQTVRENFRKRYQAQANRFRKEIEEWYGAEKVKDVKYAEAFEICEYGKQPDKAELKKLFPFHGPE